MLDSPDPPAPARFYEQLIGWEISSNSPTWVEMLMHDSQGRGTASNLAFRLEPDGHPCCLYEDASSEPSAADTDVAEDRG